MNRDTLRHVVRNFLGLIFILSGVLKLMSVQDFELYVYGFGFLSFDYSVLISRILISIEILIGVLLLLGIYLHQVVRISFVILAGFSVFILYLIVAGNREHCHCFGNFIQLSHPVSLLKNGILIGGLLYISQKNKMTVHNQKKILMYSIILSLAFPFVLAFPHTYFHTAKQDTNTGYNKTVLADFLQKNTSFTQGKQLLCFFSPGCKYCKMAAKKISVMEHRSIQDIPVHFIFFGNSKSIEKFYQDTQTPLGNYTTIPTDVFINLTEGKMPVILLLEQGKVYKKYAFDDLDETQILAFFN